MLTHVIGQSPRFVLLSWFSSLPGHHISPGDSGLSHLSHPCFRGLAVLGPVLHQHVSDVGFREKDHGAEGPLITSWQGGGKHDVPPALDVASPGWGAFAGVSMCYRHGGHWGSLGFVIPDLPCVPGQPQFLYSFSLIFFTSEYRPFNCSLQQQTLPNKLN